MRTEEIFADLSRFGPRPLGVTHAKYLAWVHSRLRLAGETPQRAVEDRGGNCIICGEAGRCPGWHTLDDIDAMPGRTTADANTEPLHVPRFPSSAYVPEPPRSR